ncbi:sugar phosphate nucleotidyltransferase [Desulfofundulus salinus]|uniref:sugar phosphate nucleotidyltransferase n=1 Tax=Desulfofundulus salinus TaxID=2419843 RepID=UPI00140378E4|nr:sugar phosphate nucleotidyltransferase [Desulfofundulus salinum]
MNYIETVRQQLPEIPPENIVAEPCGRDTAAAVGLGALHVLRKDPRGIMAVLPADHYIAHVWRFQSVLQAGVTLAASGQWLVTMGITPTRPDTGTYARASCSNTMKTYQFTGWKGSRKSGPEKARQFSRSRRCFIRENSFVM